jgi:hypothetical protein
MTLKSFFSISLSCFLDFPNNLKIEKNIVFNRKILSFLEDFILILFIFVKPYNWMKSLY